MNKKLIFLVLALVLPICIFIFLRLFGKNQFDIPVYYTEGVKADESPCQITYPAPYVLPDSVLQFIRWNKSAGATVIVLEASREEESDIDHLRENFSEKELEVLFLSKDSLNLPKKKLSFLTDCVFLVKRPFNALLVDSQKRIRGYYQTAAREELDRLDVELKILLKEY